MNDQPKRYGTVLVLGDVTDAEYNAMACRMVQANYVIKSHRMPDECRLSKHFSTRAKEDPGVDLLAAFHMARFLKHNKFCEIAAVLSLAYPEESRYQPPWDLIQAQVPSTAARYEATHDRNGLHLRFDGSGLGQLEMSV